MPGRLSAGGLSVALALLVLAVPRPGLRARKPGVHFLARIDIENRAAKLREPSGVVFSPDERMLRIVSDNADRIYPLALDGGLLPISPLPLSRHRSSGEEIRLSGLEGVTLRPGGRVLVAVREGDRRLGDALIEVELATGKTVVHPLADLAGYGSLPPRFDRRDNDGLEGVAWNGDRGTFFVLKEHPGVLVEISADLTAILAHRPLGDPRGFCDNDVDSEDIDYSGMCYDTARRSFWIVSDEARRLFRYSWDDDEVEQRVALSLDDGHEIDGAEGVTLGPDGRRLYIVSDPRAELYVFEIEE